MEKGSQLARFKRTHLHLGDEAVFDESECGKHIREEGLDLSLAAVTLQEVSTCGRSSRGCRVTLATQRGKATSAPSGGVFM